MLILRLIIIELVVSAFVGAIPLAYGYVFEGIPGLERMLSSMLPLKSMVYYSIALSMVAAFIDWADRFYLKINEASAAVWGLLSDIASQVAPSMQTILRLATGIIFTFVFLWKISDPASFDGRKALALVLYGFVALLESIILSWFQAWVATRWPRYRSDGRL